MKAELIARPTEYRGIQYRSKCEAMFAMYLELRHNDHTNVIEYEPEWGCISDYSLDFAVHSPNLRYTDAGFPYFFSTIDLIEYKPSRPTISYLSRVLPLLKSLANSINSERSSAYPYIYWGSVYGSDRGFSWLHPERGIQFTITDWLQKYEREIRDYRFDLESGA